MRTAKTTCRRHGFALVEAYITILILAVFGTLFWASTDALRQRTQQAACIDNLRQLYRGWIAYAEENHDVPVPLFVKVNHTGKSWKDNAYWASIMSPYLPGFKTGGIKPYAAMAPVTNIAILRCPAEPAAKVMSSYGVNYGMNYQIFQSKAGKNVRVKEIVKCRTTALFADSSSYVSGPTWGYGHLRFRHLDGVNIIFADGHVEWVDKAQLPEKNQSPWPLK